MKTTKEIFQVLIALSTAVFGAIYIALGATCKDCDMSWAEKFGQLAIFFLIGVIIIVFWGWLFLPSDETTDKEKADNDNK